MSPGGQGTGRGARPSCGDGRWSAAVPTDRATDPEQVNMPARNKKGVSGGHASSITRAIPFCPGTIRPCGTAAGQWRARACPNAHVSCQLPWLQAYSRRQALFRATIRGSALPDPAERRLGRLGRRQMLAVAPGAARALDVAPVTARFADHAGIFRCPAARGPGAGRQGQAAFARRILRRRSEARSSSFRPPQVPYFSGRDTA
jgi:hypothetical protein